MFGNWGDVWGDVWADVWAETASAPAPAPAPAPAVVYSGGGNTFGVRISIPFYEQRPEKPGIAPAPRLLIDEEEALLLAVL